MSEKKIKEIKIKFEIRIKQCMYVPDFSQFGELQFLRPNFPQKTQDACNLRITYFK